MGISYRIERTLWASLKALSGLAGFRTTVLYLGKCAARVEGVNGYGKSTAGDRPTPLPANLVGDFKKSSGHFAALAGADFDRSKLRRINARARVLVGASESRWTDNTSRVKRALTSTSRLFRVRCVRRKSRGDRQRFHLSPRRGAIHLISF